MALVAVLVLVAPLNEEGTVRLILVGVLVVLVALFSWQVGEFGTAGAGTWAALCLIGMLWYFSVLAFYAHFNHARFLEMVVLEKEAWLEVHSLPRLLSAGLFFFGVGLVGLLRAGMLNMAEKRNPMPSSGRGK